MVTRTDKNSYKWWQGGWRLQQWWGQGHYNSRLLTETWLPCQYAKQTGGSIDPKKSSHVPHHLLHLRRRRRPHLRSGFSFERSTLLMKYRLKQETRKPVKSSNMLILSITLSHPTPITAPFLSQLACFGGRTSDRCLIYHSCQPIYLKIECILPSVFNIMFTQGRYFWELLISRVVERKSFTGQPLPVYPSNSG